MLAGRSQSRRLLARSISQSGTGVATQCQDRIRRPGLRFPPWPSIALLVQRSSFTQTTRSSQGDELSSTWNRSSQDVPSSSATTAEPDDYDEWNTITALESSRKQLDWRHQLVTEAQFEFESDLSDPNTEGNKLVDVHQADFELWQELFLYRLRVHGSYGVKELWKHMLSAASVHKTRLWELPRLWRTLETVAVEDEEVLSDLVRHVNHMNSIFKDKPDGFYERIIVHMLSHDDNVAIKWHQILRSTWPDRREVKSLFKSLCEDESSLERFKKLCFQIPAFTKMYGFAIPYLTQKKLFTQAVAWHELFISHNDFPPDFTAVDRLLRQLKKMGYDNVIFKIAKDLKEAGLIDGSRWLRQLDLKSSDDFERTVEAISSSKYIKDSQSTVTLTDHHFKFDDSFVARLFATTFFSFQTIVHGLRGIRCTSIGPLSFREAILRMAEGEQARSVHVHEALNVLGRAGISVDHTAFCRLVVSLADRRDNEILKGLLESDQHPDALEDIQLQESLLANYLRRGDEKLARVTQEIIWINDPARLSKPWEVPNLCLEHAAKYGDKEEVSKRLNEILAKRERISTHIFDYAWKALLSPRRGGHRPASYSDLDTMIVHLVTMMRIGNRTRPQHWIDIIQRLGFAKRIDQLEQTSTWLVNWCKDSEFRRRTMLVSGRGTTLPDYDDLLLRVFNKNTLQGIVTWGFAASTSHENPVEQLSESTSSREERVAALVEDPSLRGVQILRTLRDRGLIFSGDHDEVRQACRLALIRMFGPAKSSRRVNRQIMKRRRASFVDYAAAMERIWGKSLFFADSDMEEGERLKEYSFDVLLTASLRLERRRQRDRRRSTVVET